MTHYVLIHGAWHAPSRLYLRGSHSGLLEPRGAHCAKGSRCARHYDLIRHSLIGSKRRFRGKQIRSDVGVLVGRAAVAFAYALSKMPNERNQSTVLVSETTTR
jgi:hypothetical protein